MGGEGGTGALTDRRRQQSLPGTSKPTWCCHGMEENEWHVNESSSPVHCACLICPRSFLHQPIFTDTATPPTPSLTATYITLTNQRPQGFLPHIYHWHLLFKPVTPFSGGDSYSIITAVRHYIHLLCIYIIFLFILYISESISLLSNTITTHSYSFFPPPLLCLPSSFVGSRAYWHVTLEWGYLRACVCT